MNFFNEFKIRKLIEVISMKKINNVHSSRLINIRKLLWFIFRLVYL